jgi:hypothetical protein
VPTRNSDAPMCCHKLPSRTSSTVPVTTCHGVGNTTLALATMTTHHTPMINVMTAIDGKTRLAAIM